MLGTFALVALFALFGLAQASSTMPEREGAALNSRVLELTPATVLNC